MKEIRNFSTNFNLNIKVSFPFIINYDKFIKVNKIWIYVIVLRTYDVPEQYE